MRGAVNPPRRGHTIPEEPVVPSIGSQPRRRVTETKRQKFIRVTNTRMWNIGAAFDELCKVADREYYMFTEIDIEMILDNLNRQVRRVEDSFANNKKAGLFKLEE